MVTESTISTQLYLVLCEVHSCKRFTVTVPVVSFGCLFTQRHIACCKTVFIWVTGHPICVEFINVPVYVLVYVETWNIQDV